MFLSLRAFADPYESIGQRTLTAEDLLGKIKAGAGKNFVLVDCRPEDEFQAGHIPGAINVSMDSFTFGKETVLKSSLENILKQAGRIMDFILIDGAMGKEYMPQSKLAEFLSVLSEDRYQEIIFYCRSAECTRSPMAVRWALTLGYRNVWRYEGGWMEWSAMKFPVERNETF